MITKINTPRNRSQRRKYVILLTIMLPFILAACGILTVRGSGNMITETRDVHNFNRVVFGGTGELLLTQSGEESLIVEADDNLMGYVESEMRGETLHIGIKDSWGAKLSPTQPFRFRLNVKGIVSLHVSGAANAQTGGIVTDRLEVRVSGLSSLSMGELRAQELMLHLSGSNEVELTGIGEVTEQEIVISGSNHYRAPGLRSQNAEITISGSSSATVWVTDILDVTVSGRGSVNYYGSPQVTQNGSGLVNISSLGNP